MTAILQAFRPGSGWNSSGPPKRVSRSSRLASNRSYSRLFTSASGDPKYSSTRGDEPATTGEYQAHDAPKGSVIHPSREGVCALVQSGNMITDQIRSSGYLMTCKGISEWEVEVR